jgi:hypothetical protein
MGSSYHANLILGAIVKAEEVYDQEQVTSVKCPACKESVTKGYKCCYDCGNRLFPGVINKWKAPVLAALQKRNPRWKAELTGPHYFESPFFDVADEIVVGEQLANVDRFSRRAVHIPASTLDAARERVQSLYRDMQLPNREICLFPYVFVC